MPRQIDRRIQPVGWTDASKNWGLKQAQQPNNPTSSASDFSPQECLIKGLQAHISFLQELLTGDGCELHAEMLAEERQKSNELLQLLEKKSLMCEDCQGEEMPQCEDS